MYLYYLFLAILNFLDMAFTAYGLKIGFITEANPLMRYLWETSPYLFIGIKIFFSILLIIVMYYFVPHPKNKWKWHIALAFVTFCYSILLILHLQWIVLYLQTI